RLAARFRSARVCGRRRFSRFVDLAVPLRQLFFQHLQLLLLRLNRLPQFFDLSSQCGICFFGLGGRFRLRGISSLGGLRICILRRVRESCPTRQKQRRCDFCIFFHPLFFFC